MATLDGFVVPNQLDEGKFSSPVFRGHAGVAADLPAITFPVAPTVDPVLPVFEEPAGALNQGAFTTSGPYTAGSLAVLINGQLIDSAEFTETDPTMGTLTITNADSFPTSGAWGSDQIAVFYLGVSADLSIAVTQQISSDLGPVELPGSLTPAIAITGALTDT